jgi:putative ABC transport system permease protein
MSERMGVLRRVTGLGSAGSLALALLAGGCVLAATAGPRQAQATEARALQQTMDGVTPLDKTIVVGSSWARVSTTVESATGSISFQNLTRPDADDVTTQLRRDFGTGPLRLTPRSTDWLGMNPGLYGVLTAPPSLKGIPAKLEVAYRYPVADHLRLVAGAMPDTAPPPTSDGAEEIYHLQVVVTPQTARTFALRPGSQLPVNGPLNITLPGKLTEVRLDVTGIVEPADPGSSFWTADPLLPAPALSRAGGGAIWEGAVIADPGEIDVVQQIFGQAGLLLQWELPVDATGLHDQAQALYDQVNQITNRTPALTGRLAPMANALDVSSGLVQPLAAFTQAAGDVNVLRWIVYAGLAVAGVVALLLAAQMIAARRSAELAVRRARGASLWQLCWLGTRGAAVACGPAAALAWVVAVLLVPGAAPAGPAAWWPGIATFAFAATSPGAAAAWQHRLSRLSRPNDARQRWPWLPRVVFEVTACAAAIGGIMVFRTQPGGTGGYASAAPVLVAIPAVIVTLRLYALLLRALARASARRRGIIGYLGLTRAAQAPVTLALPAMTVVLALTLAAFTGMVRAAVVRGETTASWQATGADVVVASPGQPGISPPAVRAIAAVPGVRHAAPALVVPLAVAGGGQVVTAIVVDPASYAALVASTEGFSPVSPALLTPTRGQGALPVLASPQAAPYLGGRGGSTIFAQEGLPALRVRVSGELRSTPALPGGGAFIVLPSSAIRGVPPVNLVLLTGPSIDVARLSAVVQATTPGSDASTVTTRSRTLQGLTEAPLQQGTFLLFTLAVGYAAALALAVMLLELALSAADRELISARLATMGLTEGQRVRLVAVEVIPSIAASAIAAAACAIALPRLVAPAIDLSVFTHSAAPVPLRPDFASFVLPLAVLLATTVIALAYEIRSKRGPGVAMTMRT